MTIQTALAIAAIVFPNVCHGTARPLVAEAAPQNPTAIAEAWPSSCTIRLRNDWRDWDGPALCHAILHEYGHLAGLNHTTNPYSVMYATAGLNRLAWRPRRCR